MTEAGYLLPDEAPTHDEIAQTAGPVVLEFGTDWCGHCRALAPQVKRLLEAHPGVRHVKVEDGSGRKLGRAFRVKLWPNLVFLKDGAVLRQLARPSNQDLRDAFAELSA
ncbi:MAG: thioredoxin family protein [Vicinamibacteria bacterium]